MYYNHFDSEHKTFKNYITCIKKLNVELLFIQGLVRGALKDEFLSYKRVVALLYSNQKALKTKIYTAMYL